MSISTAMILAAGRGQRLRPLTDSTPKPLIKVAGKRLIEYHIENLVRAGISKIIINTAWLSEQFQPILGDGTAYGVRIKYSNEAEALETAGGIVRALPLLGDRFIVVNGDIWSDFDFSAWVRKDMQTQAHLLLVNNPEHNKEGDFAVEHGVLTNAGATMYTYSGIGLFSAEFFRGQASGKAALAPMIRQKNTQSLVSAEVYPGQWTDVGSLKRLQQLEQHLEQQQG